MVILECTEVWTAVLHGVMWMRVLQGLICLQNTSGLACLPSHFTSHSTSKYPLPLAWPQIPSMRDISRPDGGIAYNPRELSPLLWSLALWGSALETDKVFLFVWFVLLSIIIMIIIIEWTKSSTVHKLHHLILCQSDDFTDGKTEAQRSEVTSLRLHSY